jgi:MFS family permease
MMGYLAAELIIHKVPRKKSSFIGMGLAAFLCLVLGVMVMFETEDNLSYFKWLETAVLMLNRFILCCVWSIFFVYVAELYPTEVRSLGFGWTSVAGMAGSILSPFVKRIAANFHINSWFPPAAIGIAAWLFTTCLKETFGKPLQDTIEERI